MASEAEVESVADILLANSLVMRTLYVSNDRGYADNIRRIIVQVLDAAEKARGEEDVFVNTEDSLHGDVDIQVRGMTENYGVLRPIVAVVKRGYKLVIRKVSEGGK